MGRDAAATLANQPRKGFNPRARVGRDGAQGEGGNLLEEVSIHAPAWGATHAMPTPRRSERCFNPRARVGRDARGRRPIGHLILFQSTRPRGARPSATRVAASNLIVSIHAPAWGATPSRDVPTIHRLFQSTRPRGARRRIGSLKSGEYFSFNPRARVGRDLATRLSRSVLACFNPRARVGRDIGMSAAIKGFAEFQSTRPRGARRQPSRRQCYSSSAFQSTRPRGARPHDIKDKIFRERVSIHAPAWGATQPR